MPAQRSPSINAAAEPTRYCSHASPLGPMTLASCHGLLRGVWFDGQRHMPDMRGWQQVEPSGVLMDACQQLNDYFAGTRAHFDLALDWRQGTPFQRAVWERLCDVAQGRTCSYGDLALACGRPSAVRAVGAAVGRNPWSIVVPCHRVLGRGGALTGYAGGIERKSALLQLEHAL